MIVRSGSQWRLYPHKVKYTQHNEEKEQWALPNRHWWEVFEKDWEHTEIIEFEEVSLTHEQLMRYEDIKYLPEDYPHEYEHYILSGEFKVDGIPKNHPFVVLKALKENEIQDSYLLDLDFRQSMMEL